MESLHGLEMATDMGESSGRRENGFLTLKKDCRSCMSALCCNCVDNTGGTLCLRPGKTNLRLRFMWAFIGLVSVLMWIVFLKLVFGKQAISSSPTDMRIVDEHISSVFCSRFSVTTESRLTVYELLMYPNIDESGSVTYTTSIETLLTATEYVHRNFYMLKGSRIRLSSHSTGDLWLRIITGHSNWMAFTKGEQYEEYSVYCRYIQDQENDSFEFTVKTSDDIFIVYSAVTNSLVKSNIALDRKVYDVTRTIYTCIERTQCDFELQFGTPAYIVYRTSDIPYNETSPIETYCQPRIQFYLLIFMFCPIVIGLSVTCLMYYFFPERQSSNVSDEHSRLLRLDTSSSYMFSSQQAVVQTPPKYEDLERDGFKEMHPPSYDDVFEHSAYRQNQMNEVDLTS